MLPPPHSTALTGGIASAHNKCTSKPGHVDMDEFFSLLCLFCFCFVLRGTPFLVKFEGTPTGIFPLIILVFTYLDANSHSIVAE